MMIGVALRVGPLCKKYHVCTRVGSSPSAVTTRRARDADANDDSDGFATYFDSATVDASSADERRRMRGARAGTHSDGKGDANGARVVSRGLVFPNLRVRTTTIAQAVIVTVALVASSVAVPVSASAVGTHCLTNANDLAPCQTSDLTACCAAIGDWNDNGCFCDGVDTALDETQSAGAAYFASQCPGVDMTTSASDATCVAAAANQASDSSSPSASPPPPAGPLPPEHVHAIRTGEDKVTLLWTPSVSSDVIAYAIDACDAANIASCATPERTTVLASAGSSYTFSSVSTPSTMVYRIKSATQTAASESSSPTSVPMLDARSKLIVSTSSSASSAASCGSWDAPCDSIPSALAATSSTAATRTVLLLPGVHATSCGSTLGSADVEITTVGGALQTTVDCAEASRGFTIAGTSNVLISGLTITRGLASTGGGIMMEDAPSVVIDSVDVVSCKSQTMGGGMHLKNSQPIVRHSRFISNSGGNDETGNNVRGGGAYLQEESHATLLNVSFIGNSLVGSGKGAGLNVDENSNVTANGIVLADNTAFFAAGLFVGQGCHGTFDNVLATGNEASYGAAIGVFIGGRPTFTTGRVAKNTASLWGAGAIVYTGAHAYFDQFSFEENEAEIGAGIFMYSQSSAVVDNSRVLSNKASKFGAGLRLDDRSSLSVSNTRISHNVATLGGGGGHVTTGAELTSSGGVSFVNNTAADGAGLLCDGGDHGGGNVIMSDVVFTENKAHGLGGAMHLTGACGVQIGGSSAFNQNQALSGSSCRAEHAVGGGAFALEPNTEAAPTTLTIDGPTTVNENSAPNGGGIFVIPAPVAADVNSPRGAQVRITSATLADNVASGCDGSVRGSGGALHVVAGNHTLSATTIDSNTALHDGGAVFTAADAAMTIESTDLSANEASRHGGAVAHTGAKLKVMMGTISENRAVNGGGVYIGGDANAPPQYAVLGSQLTNNDASRGGGFFFASNVALGVLRQLSLSTNRAISGQDAFWLRSSSPTTEYSCASCVYSHADGTTNGKIATEALSVQSAKALPSAVESGKVTSDFSVKLIDFYSNAVENEMSPTTCEIRPVQNSNVAVRDSLEIGGSDSASVEDGVATFSGTILRGELGEEYAARVSCTREANSNLVDIAQLELTIGIGLCLPGSEPLVVQHADGVAVARECTVCKDRTFNFDGIKCRECPEGGYCRGGTSLDSLPGWWRSSDVSDLLFSCPVKDACAAGNSTGVAACEEGYEGPVCALCAPGYRHWGGKCSKCGSDASLAVPALGIMVFIAFFVYIFQKPLKQAVGTVIFSAMLFVAQIVGLLKEYDIAWPDSIGRFVEVLDITNFNMESLTPGCSGSESNYYSTYVTAVIVPPGVTAFCVLIYALTGVVENRAPFERIRNLARDARSKCRRNAMWLVVLSYSGVAKTVLQLYNQRHLDVGVYLRRDYSIDASGSEHMRYRITGYIALLMYPIGIPVVITALLLKHRKRLDDPAVEANFGFLYKNLREQVPFWELTGLFLKFLLAAIPVFANERLLRSKSSGFDTSSEFNGATQISMAQFSIGVVLVAMLCLRPYKRGLHNVQFSIAIGIVYCFISLSANVFNAGDTYTQREQTSVAAVAMALAILALVLSVACSIVTGEFARNESNSKTTGDVDVVDDDDDAFKDAIKPSAKSSKPADESV